ncbi:hypothetical protein [uncultured Clostridium sp.]|jgi:hypothetical protein|uniref:hypothetical protein n=1 Tax=uncultured Clostridium sp. TaxID=59620 RepID=UPI0026293874|nr:hypothetical protein [uncultured Clostridium sp.]
MNKKSKIDLDKDIEVIEAEIVEVIEENNYMAEIKKYTKLKVFIDMEKENIHQDFSLPLALLKMFSGIASIIPEDNITKIGKEGFDFRNYDFKKLLKDIETGQLRNPIIYKSDDNNGKVKIKIYVD